MCSGSHLQIAGISKIIRIYAMRDNHLATWISRPTNQKIFSLWSRLTEPYYYIQDKLWGLDYANDKDTSYLGRKNHPYAQGSASYFKQFISESKQFGPIENFIDVGCGKGRMVITAEASREFKIVIGVDYSFDLVKTARLNIIKKGFKSIIYTANAEEFLLPPGRFLIYMFNPFDQDVLMRFVQNNMTSLHAYSSVILYHNKVYSQTLIDMGFNQKASRLGYNTAFYWL